MKPRTFALKVAVICTSVSLAGVFVLLQSGVLANRSTSEIPRRLPYQPDDSVYKRPFVTLTRADGIPPWYPAWARQYLSFDNQRRQTLMLSSKSGASFGPHWVDPAPSSSAVPTTLLSTGELPGLKSVVDTRMAIEATERQRERKLLMYSVKAGAIIKPDQLEPVIDLLVSHSSTPPQPSLFVVSGNGKLHVEHPNPHP